MKKIIFLLLLSNMIFSQSTVVSGGNNIETFGEVFPIMQTVIKPITVPLSIPKYELPIEKSNVVIRKKTLLERLIEWIKKLTNK